MMNVLYSIFLMTASWQDAKSRKIPIWLFALFGAIGAAVRILGKQAGMADTAAFLPGLFLLAVCACTGGAVGAGDGCFFLVSACFLTPGCTVLLFLCGLLCCGACSLGMFTWGFVRKIDAGKIRLPFLPFLIPAWVWIVFLQRGGGL